MQGTTEGRVLVWYGVDSVTSCVSVVLVLVLVTWCGVVWYADLSRFLSRRVSSEVGA